MLYERKVKIVLHGYFKELYPDEINLSGSTVAEVINGLCRQTKAFNVNPGDDRHCFRILGFDSKESLYEPIPANTNELHIVPQFCGGKSGGFFRIVIGVVLIGVSLAFGGAGFLAAPMFGTTLGSMLFNFGVSLVLGGLLEILSPAPKIDRAGVNGVSDPEASKYLGATQNTVRIGTRIPILYGEHIAYGHYLSFDVDSKDVAV